MRVLAHIHTFNDADVIEKSLHAVLSQTRPVDGIVIVDNGSTDRTLDRDFPENVTVLRHSENLGTNGAVRSGMAFALEHGYEWIWILDADSAPHPDALQVLLDTYARMSAQEKKQVHRLCSLPIDATNHEEFRGMVVTPRGFRHADPPPDTPLYECTGAIWSGSLFRTEAIRDVGLPSPEYVLDWGEIVYGYQGMTRSRRTYVVRASVMEHNIDGAPTSAIYTRVRIGPIGFNVMELPPIRFYYIVRNELFFWLHEYDGRCLRQTLRLLPGWSWMAKHVVKFALLGRWTEFEAILRGFRDGVLGRMDRRY